MNKFPKHYRQGDVLVIEIDAIPSNATPVEREGGRVILAHGELTGHAHAFAAPNVKQLKTPEGRFYFQIDGGAPTPLQHEEHTAIPFAPRKYRNARQVEYAPEALRNVAD
jgi:hypothetical protein